MFSFRAEYIFDLGEILQCFFNKGNFVNLTDETAMTVTETGGRRGIVASTGSDMRKTNAGSMARAKEASQELRVRK